MSYIKADDGDFIHEDRRKLESIAVAFSSSLVECIPEDEWDEKPDEIIAR